MSFGIYLFGYVVLIVGLSMGAHLLNVPTQWIVVGDICLVGIAILHGVTATLQKGSAEGVGSPGSKLDRSVRDPRGRQLRPVSAPERVSASISAA